MRPEATDIHNARIGIAGCGRMGQPMAEALLRAGFNVTGFDVRPSERFGAFANHLQPNPQEFAKTTHVLITVVRDQRETEALLFEEQGLLRGEHSVHTLVVSSTLSPTYLAELAQKLPGAIVPIDAPMSGAAIAAQEARLSFMLGGDEARIAWLMPLFLAMGTKLHRLGAFGAGMKAKVLNNLVAAASVTATREALRLGAALGVESDRLLEVLHDSSGQTWFGTNFDRIEFARDGYDPANSIGVLTKDLQCLRDALGAFDPTDSEMTDRLIAALRKLPPLS